MPGEWIFGFNWDMRAHLNLNKYQELLLKIHEEFAPQFATMDPSVGTGIWNAGAGPDGKPTAPADTNVFAQFSYKCTRPHVANSSNPDHGKWSLLWDPTLTDVDHLIHARCAPAAFKVLSNQIQKKLTAAFPAHFIVLWKNGLSGYQSAAAAFDMTPIYAAVEAVDELINPEGNEDSEDEEDVDEEYDEDSDEDEEDPMIKAIRQAMIHQKWSEDERCIHHLPWSYCCDCSEDVLEMYGGDQY